MKAFEIRFETGGKLGNLIVLCENEEAIEKAVSEKEKTYVLGNRYCKILFKKEVPLSTVMLSQLSVAEWLALK